MSAQRDADFYLHAEKLIYFNSYDSAEIMLRDKLAEDIVDDETFFYTHLYLARMYMKIGALNKWDKEIDYYLNVSDKSTSYLGI